MLHRGVVEEGTIAEGDEAVARIDGARRDAIRRNHTATHILHWALREVLGQHVKQAGSFVGPDRLRFDFSHHEALTREQLDRIEALANAEIIGDAPVRHYETTKEHAESLGAIAFFGDKYGDLVRVLEAGEHSIELCGGTHVHALGFIGPIKIVSEGSIGANLRRIEAVTGAGALARIHDEEVQLRELADTLRVDARRAARPRGASCSEQVKQLQDELGAERAKQAGAEAATLAAAASDGVVVLRRDGLDPGELRTLAIATRDALGSGIVALVGLDADGDKAGLAVAVSKDRVEAGASAAEIARDAAKALGGGTAKHADVVQGGGPNVGAVDDALGAPRHGGSRRQARERSPAGEPRPRRRPRVAPHRPRRQRSVGRAGQPAFARSHAQRRSPTTTAPSWRRRRTSAPRASWSGCRVRSTGELGPAARSVLDEIEALRALARAEDVEVDTYDERFTTMIAQRNLRDANPRRSKRRAAQRDDIDASAAAVILQSWLDAAAPRVTATEGGGPDEPWHRRSRRPSRRGRTNRHANRRIRRIAPRSARRGAGASSPSASPPDLGGRRRHRGPGPAVRARRRLVLLAAAPARR